jgi:predicted ArsR family transcriptional regulator
MNFLTFLKTHWRDMTPLEVITKELAQAHLDRLEAEGAVEYATAVLAYNEKRIERLNERLKEYKQ